MVGEDRKIFDNWDKSQKKRREKVARALAGIQGGPSRLDIHNRNTLHRAQALEEQKVLREKYPNNWHSKLRPRPTSPVLQSEQEPDICAGHTRVKSEGRKASIASSSARPSTPAAYASMDDTPLDEICTMSEKARGKRRMADVPPSPSPLKRRKRDR